MAPKKNQSLGRRDQQQPGLYRVITHVDFPPAQFLGPCSPRVICKQLPRGQLTDRRTRQLLRLKFPL